jgi:hypothetical protein
LYPAVSAKSAKSQFHRPLATTCLESAPISIDKSATAPLTIRQILHQVFINSDRDAPPDDSAPHRMCVARSPFVGERSIRARGREQALWRHPLPRDGSLRRSNAPRLTPRLAPRDLG